jgi:hypothetical protein
MRALNGVDPVQSAKLAGFDMSMTGRPLAYADAEARTAMTMRDQHAKV